MDDVRNYRILDLGDDTKRNPVSHRNLIKFQFLSKLGTEI